MNRSDDSDRPSLNQPVRQLLIPGHMEIFGDGAGRKAGNIKRAWETAILKAHGYKPEWVRGRLSAAPQRALATIDLHFHDLRHEAGCRWLENGVVCSQNRILSNITLSLLASKAESCGESSKVLSRVRPPSVAGTICHNTGGSHGVPTADAVQS